MVTTADRRMLSKLRVLVVDDQDMLALLVPFLQDIDVRKIYRATDGVTAIEMMNTLRPGVQMVICDWDIPKRNGLDILKHVRQHFIDIPFVMLAADVPTEALTSAQAEGVTAYLAKPFNVVTLQERVIAAARAQYDPKPQQTDTRPGGAGALDVESLDEGSEGEGAEKADDSWEI